MNLLTWEEFLRNPLEVEGPVSLTVGVFDGVHRGHQALLHELSRDEAFYPLVFTFSSNPSAVLHPKNFLGCLSTLPQRLEKLENFGVMGGVIIDFSPAFSRLEGGDFLALLTERLRVGKLVFGGNHKLGRRGRVGPREAREFCESQGIALVVVPSIDIDKHRVSSSLIRRALHRGKLALAEELLGAPYTLDLRMVPLRRRGGEVQIKKELVSQILPPPGGYPVRCASQRGECLTELTVGREMIAWMHPVGLPVEKLIF